MRTTMALLLAVAQQRAPSNIGIDIRKILDQVTGARLAIVALLAVIVVIFVLTMTRKLRSRSHARIVGQATALPGVDLSPILELDPDFSQHHFEDFAFRLFTTAHRQRDLQEKLSTLSQLLSEDARRTLLDRYPKRSPAELVIVRSLRFTSLVMPAPPRDQHCYVKAVFHANVTNRDLGTRHTHSFVEVWTFSRIPTAAHATDDYEWYVDSVVLKTQQREPPAPAADVQFDQSEPEVRRPFAKAVPAPHAQPVSSDDVIARTTFIFAELIRFWTDENLEPLRPLMTNRLFHSVAYRLMDYRTKDLRNAIVGAQVTHAEVVRSSRDRRFDIATVRIRRSERNFTVRRKSGAIIAGNNAESHVYDEDWTLLRSTDQPGALWVLSRIDRAP